jgi:hypothetical protein
MSNTYDSDGRPSTPLYDQASAGAVPDGDGAYAPALDGPDVTGDRDAPIVETYSNVPLTTPATATSGATGSDTGPTADGGTASDKADAARHEAASVAGDAKQSAQQVAGTTKEQAGKVASEAAGQAKQLFGQAAGELKDQAGAQQEKAAAGLRSVGEQLGSMAQGSDGGIAQELVSNLSGRAYGVAEWLEGRDPGSLLADVKQFAARKPGTFIAIAAVSGLLAGRVVKSLTAEAGPDHDGSPAARTDGVRHAADTTSSTAVDDSGVGPVAGEYDVITEGDVPGYDAGTTPSSSTPTTWPVQGEARP